MSQVKAIDNLINECRLRYFAFEREHRLLNTDGFTMSEERVSQRLRYFATDLYSVLDYLCYLCYCHYKNNGNPNNSREARNVKFPYKELKISDVLAMNNSWKKRTRQFVEQHFNTIFNNTGLQPDEFDEATRQLYNAFEEFILSCQIVTKVDGQENPVPQDEQPPQRDNAKNFNTLHYLRNTTVHRNLIDIAVERAWLYVNLRDGSHEVSVKIPQRIADSQNWQSIEVSPGCWITPPSVGSVGLETETVALLVILPKLLNFVIDTRNSLLQTAFSDQIAEFNRDTVRRGLNDGVRIDQNGDGINIITYNWTKFDEMYRIR